jgi:hypothetical protein
VSYSAGDNVYLPLSSLKSQTNALNAISSHLFKIKFNVTLPSIGDLPTGLFLSDFSTKSLYAILFFPFGPPDPASHPS